MLFFQLQSVLEQAEEEVAAVQAEKQQAQHEAESHHTENQHKMEQQLQDLVGQETIRSHGHICQVEFQL